MVNKKPQTKLDCDDNEKVTHLRWLTDDKIALALHSDEEAHHFMIWLGSDISCTSPSKNGDFSMTRNKWNSDNTTELHETTKYPYQHRIHASMLVLNAVRDASRGFLSSKSHSSDDIRITPAKPVTTKAAYDSAFPSLPMTKAGNPQKPYRADTPNVLIGRKKNTKKTVPIEKNSRFFQEASIKQKKKPKRRIRPNLSPVKTTIGNLSTLPSEDVSNMRNLQVKSNVNKQKNIDSTTKKEPMLFESKKYILDQNSMKIPNVKQGNENSFPQDLKDVNDAEVVKSSDLELNSKPRRTDMLNRMAQIYSSLITNYLVPSTMLELHFIIRLLSLQDDAINEGSGKQENASYKDRSQNLESNLGPTLKSCFVSGHSCRIFASKVIGFLKPIILNLCDEILEAFAVYPSIKLHLPQICAELGAAADENKTRFIINDDSKQISSQLVPSYESLYKSQSSMSNVNNPIMALPFHPDRDSKHNYRSASQAAIYKNREECRDFLFSKIRSFQNMHAKILDPAVASSKRLGIQNAAKDLIHQKLLKQNTFWFAELFCDLLIKIGPKDIEETDVEILNHVKDGKKLQKLHQRITNKPKSLNKSSQSLLLDNQAEKKFFPSNSDPSEYFRGNQEFFFIFLRSVDSYNFGQQLCRRFVGKISSYASGSARNKRSLEERLTLQKLLAKFLGVLVFSPNWNSVQSDDHDVLGNISNIASASSTFDAQRHLDLSSPVLPFFGFLQKALEKRSLIAIIPWVLDYLRMSKWDLISQRSNYYQNLFRYLLQIQRKIRKMNMTPNIVLVMLDMEFFFTSMGSLRKIENLPLKFAASCDASTNISVESDLDSLQFTLNKDFAYTCIPLMEELYHLLSAKETGREKGKLGNLSSKKMRPYAVSTLDESIGKEFMSAYSREYTSDISYSQRSVFLSSRFRDEAIVQVQLRNAFFHQHKNIETIAAFVIGVTIKNACLQITDKFVNPTISKAYKALKSEDAKKLISSRTNFDSHILSLLLSDIKRASLTKATGCIHEEIQQRVRNGLITLLSSSINEKVLDVAIDLAIDHAIEEGNKCVLALINLEAPKSLNIYLEKQKKYLKTKSSDSCIKSDSSQELKKIIEGASFSSATESIISNFVALNEDFITFMKRFQALFNEHSSMSVTTQQKSYNSRKKIICILSSFDSIHLTELSVIEKVADELSKNFINFILEIMKSNSKSKETSLILFDAIQIILEIGKKCSNPLSLRKIGFYLCQTQIMSMYLTKKNMKGKYSKLYDDTDLIVANLNDLVSLRIIRSCELERALMKFINDEEIFEIISEFCSQTSIRNKNDFMVKIHSRVVKKNKRLKY